MLHFQRMSDEWLALALSLLGSTLITIAVSALTLRFLARRSKIRSDAP